MPTECCFLNKNRSEWYDPNRPEFPQTVSPMNRPGLLTFGIICSAIHAILALAVVAFLTLGSVVVGGIGAAASVGEGLAALPVIGGLLGLGMIFLLPLGLFYLVVLASCWGSWHGERGWLWAFTVFSFLGLINTGPISLVIGLCAIIGALMALGVIGNEPMQERA